MPKALPKPKFIAFLRAINVGGHTVTMERLRGLFEEIGCREVETFIASGNVIFTVKATDVGALERKIEAHLQKALGYEVSTFIRTVAEVAAAGRYQAFPVAEVKAAHALYVAFLAGPPADGITPAIMALKSDVDAFHINGREVYYLCKIKANESKFSNSAFERTLKGRATFRNVNTLVRLTAKYG